MTLKKPIPALLTIALIFTATTLVPAQKNVGLDELPLKYKTWLTEEVVYIITPVEKEVFLELQNNRERDLFIEAFWRQRDPSIGTPENEFRDEHYRRLDHANRRFRGTGRPGWQTGRGKVYIILGEPTDNRIFHGSDAYYPAEVWNYQGLPGTHLPQAFSVLFYKKGRIGDFRLYDPVSDGPWNLMSNYEGLPDYLESYQVLYDLEPALAQLSISLIPGEPIMTLPAMSSSLLLQKIDIAAIKEVEDRYAKKFVEFKDIVEVEYSTNYIESEAQVQIIQDRSGIFFVHYSIQPSNLSMGSFDNRIYTDLEFNGMVTDDGGLTVFQFENTVPLRFSEEQFQNMRQRPFCFTDKFPLLPGEYKFSLIVKNTVSKEFTSFDSTLKIPETMAEPQLSPLLLGFNASEAATQKARNEPFVVDDVQLYSQAANSFLREDRMVVFFQVFALTRERKENSTLKYRLVREDQEVFTESYPFSKYQNENNIFEMIPLKNFVPGYYRIQVLLMDETHAELASQHKDFVILTAPTLPRPWVLGQAFSDSGETSIPFTLGRQLLNKKQYADALVWLDKAYFQDPNNLDFGLYRAQAHYHLEKYQDALNILDPLLERGQENFEFALLYGESLQALGKFAEAIEVFDQALTRFGLSVMLLNPIGECHYRLGNAEEALAAFEKSLTIDPGQEKIQERVRSLKR
jgi:GWxTD domain-containing protein